MQIPLRFTVPDSKISRLVVPLIFMGAGVGLMVWYRVEGPVYAGPQRYVPYLVGGFLILTGAFSIVRERSRVARQEAGRRALEEHRDAPWRVRPEWRRDELVATATVDRSLVVFAVLWNLFAWPLAYFLMRSDQGEGDVWLVALFPLIGLGMLAVVAYQLVRARKFGRTVVQLDPMPLRLGRTFRGTLQANVARDQAPEDGFVVEVNCYRQKVRYTRDSDGDRTRRIERDLLWRDETRIRGDASMDGARVEVPFAFRLPEEMPPSTPLKLDNRIVWEVAAEADVPGIDFAATVEVPVFPAEPGSVGEDGQAAVSEVDDGVRERAAAGATASTTAAPVEVGDPEAAWAFDEPLTEGIELIEEPDRFKLHFTAARNRKGAIVMGVLGAALLVGGFPLTSASGPMGLIFIAMGGLLVFGSIQQGTNDTVLRVRGGRIQVTHDGIGMPADVDVPVERIDDVLVDVEPGSSENARYAITLLARAGDGLEHLEAQAAHVMGVMSKFGVEEDHPAMEAMRKGADQPRISVASGLADKDEADWLAWKVKQAVDCQRAVP